MTVCPNQESMGYHYEGGFAEYLVVPAKVLAVDGLNRIPDTVSFAVRPGRRRRRHPGCGLGADSGRTRRDQSVHVGPAYRRCVRR
jgi:hypothetical protein